mgnify:CR=1 FL=1|jgi:hypothetical protein
MLRRCEEPPESQLAGARATLLSPQARRGPSCMHSDLSHAVTGPVLYGRRFNVVVYTAIFTVVVLVGLDTYVDDVDPATGEVLRMNSLQYG